MWAISQITDKMDLYTDSYFVLSSALPVRWVGAGDRDRTDIISLEGWGSTIELHPQNQDGGGGGIRTSEG